MNRLELNKMKIRLKVINEVLTGGNLSFDHIKELHKEMFDIFLQIEVAPKAHAILDSYGTSNPVELLSATSNRIFIENFGMGDIQ